MGRKINGEVVRALRVAQGVGLREMGRRLGISPGHLSRIERGIHNPSAEVTDSIARELGVSALAITQAVEVAA